MQKVPIEELAENKVIPYSLFDQNGDKLFEAGDILTPGKLMQLRQVSEIYKDENENQEKEPSSKKTSSDSGSSQIIADEFEMDSLNEDVIYTIDDIDITNFKGSLNKNSKIDPEMQMKFKAYHIYALNALNTKKPGDIVQIYFNLRERIVSDIVLKSDKINFFSNLKLLGEYKKCHALNVAILGGILAYRMDLNELMISEIVLGALLHDVGKIKIPPAIADSITLTDKEQKILQTHTKIGYKILKEEFLLPENIAKTALEHHENSNGSGYPYGKSGDFIGIESRIISVCNHFDNLISNQTPQKIHNCHEALKVMLELGSKKFAADALYTFVHMFSYNDIESLEDMTV